MIRYPDGTYKLLPPSKVVFEGYIRKYVDLTAEERDEIGYNEAVPITREPFTTYTTEWEKRGDLKYYEVVVSAVVDEAAKAEAAATAIRAERDRLLAAGDGKVLQLERRIRLASAAGENTTILAAALADWDTYRAALCDVPEQAGFPDSVVWPVVAE